jgi:hypothetical protein
MHAKPGGGVGLDWGGSSVMRITSRWGRARTTAVAGAALASGLLVVVGATAPAGAAAAASTSPRVSATYSCSATIPVVGTETWTGAITVLGSAPATAAPGGAVSLTGWQAQVTIPASLVDEAAKYASSIGGKLASFKISATDSKVKTVNAAGKGGIKIPTTAITTSSGALTFNLPATPKTVKGWTAVKKGTMTFKTGNVVLDLTAATIIGNESVTATCTATPTTLATTSVS